MNAKQHRKRSVTLMCVLVCAALVAVLVPLVALAADGGDSFTVLEDEFENQAITRISTTSDVHFGEGGAANNRQRFNLLLQAMQDFHPQLLIVSGDTFTTSYTAPTTDYYGLGTTSFTSSYDEIRKAAAKYLGDIPVIITAGNHDWDVSNYYKNNAGYSSYYGLIPTQNFDVFLFGAPNNSPFNFSTAEIDGLNEYLGERDEPNKPVFVASHYPIDDPTLGATTTPPGESHPNAGNAAAAIDVLQDYDQPTIFLWGHNHNTPRSDTANIFKQHASNLRTANSGAINYRTDTTVAQGVNLTLDVADDALQYQVIRVDLDTPNTVQQIGTATQDLPGYTSGSESGGSVWNGSIASDFAGGTGTEAAPYLISNGAELAYLAQQVSGGTGYAGAYFKQTADIDLNSLPWTPIGHYIGSSPPTGYSNNAFAGTYDGDGYVIENLTASEFAGSTTTNKAFALFGYLSGTVQNVGVPGLNVHAINTGSGNAYAAGIAGYANGGDIINCYVEGDLNADAGTGSGSVQVAGGLAARTASAAITNSYAAVNVSVASGNYHGGLVGWDATDSDFQYAYWDATRHENGVENGTESGTTEKTTVELKAADFVTLLNDHNDLYKAWIADITPNLNSGYPIHERAVSSTDAETPTITGQPQDVTVSVGDDAELEVTATVSQGTLSYRWWSNTTRSNSGGTEIPGTAGDDPSYEPLTSTAGTTYYYCVVTNTDTSATSNQTAARKSNAAQVKVVPWSGSGTSGDPFLISSVANLQSLAADVNGGTDYAGVYFKQTADIDLTGIVWTPIGQYVSNSATNNYAFAGAYDGDAYVIKNLTVSGFTGSDTTNKAYALFGYLSGTVQNVGLSGLDVDATNAGSGNAYAGGIAGYANGGDIINSYAEGDLKADAGTGSSVVEAAGGAAARTGSSATITNSYAAVDVDVASGNYHGGLVGMSSSTTYATSYWDATRHTQGVQNSSSTSGTTAKTTDELQAAAFVTLLNDNKGGYKAWIADITPPLNSGYPIHTRTVVPQPPAAPTDVTATPGDGQVTVSWSAVTGAIAYKVYYGTTSDAYTQSVSDITSTSTTVTGLTNGTLYYFAVTAIGTGGESDTSAEVSATPQAPPPDWVGEGTEAEPYLIATVADLVKLAAEVNDGDAFDGEFFRQTTDIDLSSIQNWTPIGTYISTSSFASSCPFKGTYDGDGYVIANLTIDRTFEGSASNNKASGLFAFLAGTVKNLGLRNVDISSTNTSTNTSNGNSYAGGIAAYIGHNANDLSGHIDNCYVEGAVTSTGSNTGARVLAGGLGGHFNDGAIGNSYAAVTATISGSNDPDNSGAGGLVGRNAGEYTSFATSCWDNTLTSSGMAGTSAGSGATGRTTANMKTADLVTLLNTNKGENKAWAVDATPNVNKGYPVHTHVALISISGATIAAITPQAYTGAAITPTVTVTIGSPAVTLVAGADYTLTYANNTNVGTAATVTVCGAGAYVDEKSATFEIVKATPTITTPPAASAITLGESLSASDLSGGAVALGVMPVPGSFAFTTPAAVPDEVGTHEAAVTFTPTDAANLNPAAGTVPVQVYAPTDAEPATITAHPEDAAVYVGDDAELTVTATVSKGVLTYQWFSNAADSNEDGTEIPGADETTYAPPTDAAGTTYYYCVVTNFDEEATGEQYASTASAAAAVQVEKIPTHIELLTASNPSFSYGKTLTLTGGLMVAPEGHEGHVSAAALPGAAIAGKTVVMLYRDPAGKGWGEWKTSTNTFVTRADGSFTITTKPVDKRMYRVRFLAIGDPVYAPCNLETCKTVVITPKVKLGNVVAPKTARKGKAFTACGSLKPRHKAGTVVVRIYKEQKVKGKWVKRGYVKAKAVNYSSYSRYKVSMKLAKGTWRLRAQAAKDSLHAATTSAKWRVVTVK